METTTTKYSTHERSPSYSLRGYKRFKEMSEETLCFHTTLLRDGKEVATIKNDGQGGCDLEYFDSKEERERYAQAAKNMDKGGVLDWGTTEGLTLYLIAEYEAYKSAEKYFTFYTPELGLHQFGQVKLGRRLMRKDDPRLATRHFWDSFFKDEEEVVLVGMGAWVPELILAEGKEIPMRECLILPPCLD